MMTEDMDVCQWCGKPIAPLYRVEWNPVTQRSDHIPLVAGCPMPRDAYCPMHRQVRCPDCGWIVFEGYHSEETCELMQHILDSFTPGRMNKGMLYEMHQRQQPQRRKRTAVPTAFYRAFEGEEGELAP